MEGWSKRKKITLNPNFKYFCFRVGWGVTVARASEYFYRQSKCKKKNLFFSFLLEGGGGGL